MGTGTRQVDARELLRAIAQTDVSRAQEKEEIARMSAREMTRLDQDGNQTFFKQDWVTARPSTPRTPRRTTPSKGEH
jgi:hypothetical protein